MNVRSLSRLQWVLIAVTVAGLAIDAWVHYDLAPLFANHKTSTLSQADLFRVEATAAVVAAVALLIRPRRYTAGFAFLVAAAGTVAVVLYRYVDIGSFGPIPGMYDPYWAPAEKVISLIGEVVATVTALVLFLQFHQQTRRSTAASSAPTATSVGG